MANSHKNTVKTILSQLYSSGSDFYKLITENFAANFHQKVNGREFDYDGFMQHIKLQRKSMNQFNIEFEHVLEEDDKVISIHRISAMTTDGTRISARVFALFKLDAYGKIAWVDELTQNLNP